MTTPGPGPHPEDDRPPAGPWPPPPGYPYYGPQPPPGYPYYGPQPPPGYPYRPLPARSGISVWMAFVGSALYFVINLLVGLLALSATSSTTEGANAVVGGSAVLLALIAFAGGAGLLATRNRRAKGLGLGLMIGWALTSLFTVGFCTGINPTMYTSS